MKTDVAIIGAGPGGTAAALFLAQQGIRSTIIEKDSFPRYHIGESMTGECGNCLRELGLYDTIQEFGPPVKHGTTVYGPDGKNSFYVPVMARSPEGELVEKHTWSVRRSDFDELLYREVKRRDIDIVQGTAKQPLRDGDAVCGVRVKTADGETLDIHSKVLIDASGMATFLCGAGVTGKKDRGLYDNQVAVFSQVSGAIRDEGKRHGDTLIFYQKRNHWAWFIPLDEESVSIGVVVPSSYFADQGESKEDFLRRELAELNPELHRRVPNTDFTEEARAISNYSYHIKRFTGNGFICIGDSHRFIDPVFSFGVFFAVKEAQRAAQSIADYFAGKPHDSENPFEEFERVCEAGMDVVQELLDAFWNHPLAFAVFVHNRYTGDFVDMFAGRVYMDEPSRGLEALRAINAKTPAASA